MQEFVDASEFQPSLNPDKYGRTFLSLRICDGDYADPHWKESLRNATHLIMSRHTLAGLMGYVVYRPGKVEATLATVRDQLSNTHHPHVALEIDVESWGGEIRGNHQAEIERLRVGLVALLNELRPKRWRKILHHRDMLRVGIYGNAYDLSEICPGHHKLFPWVHLANYSANPAYPGKLLHQFTDTGYDDAFGRPVDLNQSSPASLSAREVCKRMGIPVNSKYGKKPSSKPAPKPPISPRPEPKPEPHKRAEYEVRSGDTITGIAQAHRMSPAHLESLNKQIKNFNDIKVGQTIYLS